MPSKLLLAAALRCSFAILCAGCSNGQTFVVTSTLPAPNETDVATNTIVTVNFDRELASFPDVEVTPDAGSFGALIARDPTGFVVMNTFSIIPRDGFAPFTGYTVTVSEANGGGNAFRFGFTTGAGPDTAPPAAVTDLAVIPGSITRTGLQLTWTASGNDGTVGTATGYELRMETAGGCPLTAASFDEAESIPTAAPKTAGQPETVTVDGLTPGTAYCFALVVADEALNDSALSNGVAAETANP